MKRGSRIPGAGGCAVAAVMAMILAATVDPAQCQSVSPAEDAASLPSDVQTKHPFTKHGGIEYSRPGDQRLTLDLYLPEGEGPFPVILAVHGGAWRSGTKLNWIRHAWHLAEAGFAVVAINYRHAPAHPFPAQIHDCKAAVRWIRKHAPEYRLDGERIGGIGYSAGGHLVALLATTDPADGLEGDVPEKDSQISTRLSAVAAGGAPCDLTWIDGDSHHFDYWLGSPRNESPEIWRQASPASFVTPDDPPFHFFHGRHDRLVPVAAARAFHEQLVERGVTSEFVLYDNGHFGLFSNLSAMDPVIAFFRKYLVAEAGGSSKGP